MKKYLLFALAVVTMAGCEKKYPVYEDVHIGDYYFADGTISSSLGAETPIGVVFEVNADNTGGIAVGLNETTAKWSTENVEIAGSDTVKGGLINMAGVMTHDATYAQYPAFAWVHAKNPSTTTYAEGMQGVWYFPSVSEFVKIYHAIETVNAQIKTIAGATLLNVNDKKSYYWTSSEDASELAWYIDISDGKYYHNYKNINPKVRAVIAF